MPIRIEYTDDEIGVVLDYEGVVNDEDLLKSITSVYEDDRFLNLKYWIADRTNCEKFLITTDTVRKIALLNKTESQRNSGILLAFVSPNDLIFGMSRMFEAIDDESLFIAYVFKHRGDADKWIEESLNDGLSP